MKNIILLILTCININLFAQESDTFTSYDQMIGNDIYFYDLKSLCNKYNFIYVTNAKGKLELLRETSQYANYQDLFEHVIFHVNGNVENKIGKCLEIQSEKNKYYFVIRFNGSLGNATKNEFGIISNNAKVPSIINFWLYARNVSYWNNIFSSSKDKYAYLKENKYESAIQDLDKEYSKDEIFKKIDFVKYDLPDIKKSIFTLSIQSENIDYEYNQLKSVLISNDDANNIYNTYLEERDKKIEEQKLEEEKRKLKELENKQIDSIFMSKPLNITCKISDESCFIAYINPEKTKEKKITNRQYIFIYDAILRGNDKDGYRLWLEGYNYKDDIEICYNEDDLSFYSYIRDNFNNSSNHPNIFEFLLRNQGKNVEMRRKIAQTAALEDWKNDSIREIKQINFIKNLVTKKIFIVKEKMLMGIWSYTAFNCFGKGIIAYKYSMTNGKTIYTSERLPALADPLTTFYVIAGHAKNEDIVDITKTKLTSLTFYFVDGSSQTFSGSQIKAHTKICLDDNNNLIIE